MKETWKIIKVLIWSLVFFANVTACVIVWVEQWSDLWLTVELSKAILMNSFFMFGAILAIINLAEDL